MRFRLLVAAGAAATLAVPFVAHAETPPFLITGGGQVIASTGDAGPGDTIAFVARQTDDVDEESGVAPAQGSLQFVQTSEAREGQRPPIIFNGQVTCIEPMGENMARFGGERRAGDGTIQFFTVDVTDSGDENRGTDTVEFQTTDQECEDGTQLNEETTLARGNLKIDTAGSERDGRGGRP